MKNNQLVTTVEQVKETHSVVSKTGPQGIITG